MPSKHARNDNHQRRHRGTHKPAEPLASIDPVPAIEKEVEPIVILAEDTKKPPPPIESAAAIEPKLEPIIMIVEGIESTPQVETKPTIDHSTAQPIHSAHAHPPQNHEQHKHVDAGQTSTSIGPPEVKVDPVVGTTAPLPQIGFPQITDHVDSEPSQQSLTDDPYIPGAFDQEAPSGALTPRPTNDRDPFDGLVNHKSVERIDEQADLATTITPRIRGRSQTNEEQSIKPSGLSIPDRPRAASSGDLRSGTTSPIIPAGAMEAAGPLTPSLQHVDPLLTATLRAGPNLKDFQVHRHILIDKVPYFAELMQNENGHPTEEQLSFPELDEYGFGLLVRWLYGGKLHGPADFHGLTHYLALYCLAVRFGVEAVQDTVMDLCRAYYRHNSMTAPAYRLEYVYSFTPGPCAMRNFLTATAAYRVLCDVQATPGVFITDAVRGVLSKGGDLAGDFAEALARLSRNGIVDVRKGADEVWHVNAGEGEALEPWQSA